MQSKEANGYFRIDGTCRKIIFAGVATACLMPVISPPLALLLGLLVTQLNGHPWLHLNHRITHVLLQVSVVGLGFGMDLHTALQTGRTGLLLTVGSISLTLVAGWLIGRVLKTQHIISFLVSAGTAICGGSAIAALSPVVKAGEKQVSVSLAVIFILNSAALFLFPAIGHWLQLSSAQFGLWCAIAIHDTSSVVGAASRFDQTALEIATTVKLTRALWIIPVALSATLIFRNDQKKIRIPWFIGLFVMAMMVNTYIPAAHSAGSYITMISKAGLTLTLFLIGSGLSAAAVKAVGFRPFLQGLLLWILISAVSLWFIIKTAG